MSKSSKRNEKIYKFFRTLIIIGLVGGFTNQTLNFLFLYWTYPTVVDIQQSSPFYLDIPAITFCNRIGYNYKAICEEFPASACMNEFFMKHTMDVICEQFPMVCVNGSLNENFKGIFYSTFMTKISLTKDDHKTLAVPLQDYLNCTIHFAGKTTSCNMENVLSSFYSTGEMPQYCYSIYSLWGKPNKERERIPKGSIMKLRMNLNFAQRPKGMINNPSIIVEGIAYNPPADCSLQLGVHDPYYLPSPYFDGYSFKCGRAYELRIKQSESHLLPYPYQTNCTDYMREWKIRGGKAPINQLGIIQECRLNRTLEAIGCIPLNIDYPHNYNICKTCESNKPCKYLEPPNNCTRLADSFNQPCDSITYQVEKENKVITIFKQLNSYWTTESDGIQISIPEHDCSGQKAFTVECSTIDIEIPFDRFDITNITYNPKYESLELFSVIGGYMGMWLGVSLLAFFDMFSELIVWIKAKREKRKLRSKKMKLKTQNNIRKKAGLQLTTTYNVW